MWSTHMSWTGFLGGGVAKTEKAKERGAKQESDKKKQEWSDYFKASVGNYWSVWEYM